MNKIAPVALPLSEDDMSVIRQLAAHVREKSTDLAAESLLIPPEVYTDPLRFEAERRDIFQNLPLLACLSADLRNPGDQYVFEDAGPPILLVRAKDGSVNAFLNMCMHRAARLVSECGNHARITCPFHAWTYDLEGRLVGVPRREAFDPAKMQGRNLARVPVGEWGGLVFVKARTGEERIDVQDWLGGFADVIAAMRLDVAKPIATDRLDFAGNWKYALDTYGEGYHVGFLHPNTVGALYIGDVISVQRFGLHYRMSFATNAYKETIGKPESEWPELEYSPVCQIFPNAALNLQPMPGGRFWLSISRVFPGNSVQAGYSITTSYKADDVPDEQGLSPYKDGHDLIVRVVGTEDYAVVAGAQKNLPYAPKNFQSILGRHEHPAADTQTHIARLIGMPI